MNQKKCTKCGEDKPETKDFYSFEGGKFRSDCKECRKKYRQSTRERINFTDRQRRALNRDFYLDKRRNYKSLNKERIATQTKDYKERNKEIIREKDKEYRLNNRERELERTKEWYQNNKDRVSKRTKAWRERNKNRVNKTNKEYYTNNREIILEKLKVYKRTEKGMQQGRLRVNKRRALKRNLESSLTLEQWRKILNAFNNCCAYCGRNGEKLSQEHFIALSKGGELSINNILPACMKCNKEKFTKDFNEWYKGFEHYDPKREQKILAHLKYYGENQQLALTF